MMADDTSQSKGINNKNKTSASRNNMGPSLGFGIDVELGSESQLSNLVEDQQRNHSIQNANSQIYSDNNARSDILYSDNSVLSAAMPMSSLVDSNIHRNQQRFAMARQGNAFSIAHSAESLRLTPSMNLNQQHMNAFNASLNAAEAINNASISRLRSPMFTPDINVSLSNTNGYPYNYHPGDNPDFAPNLSQRVDYNSFSLAGDNLLPLHTRGGEQYYGGQSILAEGMVGDAERLIDRSAGTMEGNSSIVKRRRVQDISVSDFSLTKRARNLAQQQQQLLGSNSVGLLQRGNISGRSYSIYAEKDAKNLSQYQCLVRKQIEVFEAATVDARTNAQGRNRPILPRQIGIRCRHCYKLPLKERGTGSVYYPNTLVGVYQTAQKMTLGHLLKHCSMIPPEIRERLLFLKNQKSSDGGGKRYWADGVRALGVVETRNEGLKFARP